MKKLITSVFVLSAAVAFADTAASITGVTAKQRWPWNNLVDVDFTLAAESQQADPYKIEIEAQCSDWGPVYAAKSFVTEPVVALGTHRVTWDFGRDFPNVKASNMVFTVTATTFDASQPVYLIVDLSSGPAVKKFPIRYSTVAPTPTPGQEDPCKTTEM